ncbi:hypothetical protein K0U83_17380 [bacterium]|nr:hypothetical protein [bacterium]
MSKAKTDLAPATGGFLALTDVEAAEMIAEVQPTPADLQKLVVPSGSGGAAFVIESLEGETFEKTLDVVVAYESPVERSFYATGIDEGDGGPPHCSSSDGKNGFGARDLEAINASNSYDELTLSEQPCADCRFSKFGSDLGGGKGQACKQRVRLVIFSGDALLPMVLQVPAASLKTFKQYKMKLVNGRKRLARSVTQLSLVKQSGSPDYYTVEFSYVRDLSDQETGRLAELSSILAEAAQTA